MRVKGYYYMKDGQAYLVDETLKKQIDKAVMHNREVEAGDYTLYPIFDDPTDREIRTGKTKEPVWHIRPHSTPTLRWYWQIREHKRSDAGCKPLGGGLCGFKMVRFAEWNASTNKWELLPMVNHADSEQERVLDSN